MKYLKIKALVIWLLFSMAPWNLALASNGTPVTSLAEGPPALTSVLGETSFVPVEVEKLSHAAVWYVDYEWHRQHGIEIPAQGIHSPEFAKAILDAYGWQSRSDNDPADAFTGEKKTSYADYYGGYGMGVNLGSGRAAANGIVQAKGVKTSLARSTDPFHSNGAVQSIEAVDEAVWSQILDSEMKYGSNKVVAVILTGTYGVMKDNNRVFPRALIIREMALRPAHFMLNQFRDSNQDRARIASVLPKLLDNLPYPDGYVRKSKGEDLKTGVLELVDREAITQAEYYAKRMFFGSVSPSNLEITGRRLDLGDHTSQDGYSPIYRLDWLKNSPFGGTQSFLELFEDFRQSLDRTLPGELRAYLPNKSDISRRFNATFKTFQAIEMVRLTGAPKELIDADPRRIPVMKLGEVLVKMTKAGQPSAQFTDPKGWENLGTYNVNSILTRVAQNPALSPEQILASVQSDFSQDPNLAREFANAYFQFRQDLKARAPLAGITEAALQTYIQEAAKQRNRSRPSVIRGDKRWRTLWDTTDQAIEQKSPSPVENYIEEQISQNIFNFKDAAPFQVVLGQKRNSAEGLTLRKVFDAKKNQYATILRIDISNGTGSFQGEKLSAEQMKNLSIEAKNQSVKAVRSGNFMEFTFANQKDLQFSDLRLAAPSLSHVRDARARVSMAPVCAKVHLKAAGNQ